MADLTTHLHFAQMVIDDLEGEIDQLMYYVGTVTPDTSKDSALFREHHLLNIEGKIQIEMLRGFSDDIIDSDFRSFYLGYLVHLYVDYYYDAHRSELYLSRLTSIDEKIAALNAIKHYNQQIIRELDPIIDLHPTMKEFSYFDEAYTILEAHLLHASFAPDAEAPPEYLVLLAKIKNAFLNEGFSVVKE